MRRRDTQAWNQLRGAVRGLAPSFAEWTLLALVSLLPAIRYGGHPLADTNVGLILSPASLLDVLASPWNSGGELGYDYTRSQTLALPPAVAFWILSAVGVSEGYVTQVWIGAILLTAGASMRYFVRVWLGARVPALLAGLAYLASSYVIVFVADTSMFLLGYALLPLQLALVLKLARDSTPARAVRTVGLLALTFLFVSAVDLTVLMINAFAVLLFAAGATALIARRATRLRTLATVILGVELGMLVLAWALFPMASSYRIDRSAAEANLAAETHEFYNQQTSYGEVLRLQGYWALYSGYAGRPYRAYQAYYLENPIGVACGYALVALAALGLALRRRDPVAAILAALLAVTVPLVVGAYPPDGSSVGGDLAKWFFANVPLASVFRNTFKFASVATFAAVALATAVAAGSRRRRPTRLRVVAVAAVATAIAYPLWGGTMWWRGQSLMHGVPKDWRAAMGWLDAQRAEGKVLYLPRINFPVYSWGFPRSEPGEVLATRPQVFEMPGSGSLLGERYLASLYRAIERSSPERSWETRAKLRSAQIRYLLVRGDLRFRYYPGVQSPGAVERRLSQVGGIELRRRFGRLAIYEVQGTATPAIERFEREPVDGREDVLSGARGTRLARRSIGLAATKIDPARYELDLAPTGAPTLLIFRDSYHPGWRLHLERPARGAPQPKHVRVEGFANGWLLPAGARGEATLEYAPARAVRAGRVVSALALMLALALVLAPRVRELTPRLRRRLRSQASA